MTKVLSALTFGVFANTRTRAVAAFGLTPLPFSSTNQRESSPGACSIASGSSNVGRFANTRCNGDRRAPRCPFRRRDAGRVRRPRVEPDHGGRARRRWRRRSVVVGGRAVAGNQRSATAGDDTAKGLLHDHSLCSCEPVDHAASEAAKNNALREAFRRQLNIPEQLQSGDASTKLDRN